MSDKVVRLIRESLNKDLGLLEVSARIDEAYRVFVDGGKHPIQLPKTDVEQLLSLIAYAHIADRGSAGAFDSGAGSSHSN